MKRIILPGLLFFLSIGFAVAAATPEEAAKIENLFAQLEQQPGVKPENVAALEKAKPLVLDLKGIGQRDINAQNWNEYYQLLDTYYALDPDLGLQLSIGLLTNSLDDDYVRQATVAITDRPVFSIQSSRQLIDILMLLDQAKIKLDGYNSRWLPIFHLKIHVQRTLGQLLHIPDDQLYKTLAPTLKPSTGWMLNALELAKTIPANHDYLSVIDSDIEHIKEKSASSHIEAPAPTTSSTSLALQSAAPSQTAGEASTIDTSIPPWVYGIIIFSAAFLIGLWYFLRTKK